MYAHLDVRMCVCVIYACKHVWMYVRMCMHLWMYVCMCMHVRMDVCVWMYGCTYVQYVCMCIRICMWYMSTYVHTRRTYITSHGKSEMNLSESSHFPNPGSSYFRSDPSSGSAKGSEEEESRALHLSGVPDEPKISD